MLDPKSLADTVHQMLEDISRKSRETRSYTDRDWTRQIKDGLCKIGLESGFDVNAAGCAGATEGEWMFDLTLSKSDDSRWLRLPLILESEWSRSHHALLWDFGKLIAAKADIKVFVFQQSTEDELQEMFKVLHKAIEDFEVKIPAERYLLAGYCIQADKFSFKRFVVGPQLQLSED